MTVKVDAHSELLGAYPWAARGTPDRRRQPDRHRRLRRTARSSSPTAARCPAASRTTTRRSSPPTARRRPARPAPATAARSRARSARTATRSRRAACDDGPHGKGVGGQLRYDVTVGRARAQTLWVAVAGSDRGLAAARRELAPRSTTRTPSCAPRRDDRNELAARSVVDLPGDRQLQDAVDWGKQNLADLTQTRGRPADPLRRPGQGLPAADRQRQARDVLRRRLPRLPVAVRHRRRVHGVPGGRARPVRGDQGAPERAARGLGRSSTRARARSRTRSSPTARSTSAPTPTPGNTDESVKFPSAVALVWRWTGDNRFRDRLYDFSGARCTTSRTSSTPTRTAGRRASATSSARAWARRSSTTPST